jgi:hypothetical protein
MSEQHPSFQSQNNDVYQKPPSLYYVNGIPLPFFRAVQLPPGKNIDELPILPSIVQESCGYKIITGGLMGSVLGVGLGIFMGAMGGTALSPVSLVTLLISFVCCSRRQSHSS